MKKYDIFLSYRREGGSETAKMLRDSLTERGYRVFLDVESLKSGPFNTKLFEVIDVCQDVVLVLPPHALDRCASPDDWVRLEIEHALQNGKNIVPVMLKGFEFPEALPESLARLPYLNGLRSSIEFYDAFLDKLERFLKSRPTRKLLKRALVGALAAVCVAAAALTALLPNLRGGPAAAPVAEAPIMLSGALTDAEYAAGGSVPGSGIPRASVGSVAFRDTLDGAPAGAWDMSAAGDGSVLAWMEGDALVIAGAGGVRAPVNAERLFAGYANARAIDFNGCFSTAQTTNMRGMFLGCERLEALDLSGFDTGKATDMQVMFYGCAGLETLDLSGFDTARVTDMQAVFYGCKGLKTLDLSGFDTAQATAMTSMFGECAGLETLDLSGFDTARVADMRGLFYNCAALKALDLSGFDTRGVTNMRCMFEGCAALETIEIGEHFTAAGADAEAMFEGCGARLVRAGETLSREAWLNGETIS